MADENTKTCPHDCTRCTPQQRLLCAAQFSRMNAERMDALEEKLNSIEAMQTKVADDGSSVFDPTQKGSGVKNRLPE